VNETRLSSLFDDVEQRSEEQATDASGCRRGVVPTQAFEADGSSTIPDNFPAINRNFRWKWIGRY